MKLFSLFFFLGITAPIFAQLTSGEITYRSKSWVKFENESERKPALTKTDSFSVLFNETSLLSTTSDDYFKNISLMDRKTKKVIYCTLSNDEKTFEILDFGKLTKQNEERVWDGKNRIAEIIEEPAKADFEQFQKDLIQKITKDTSLLLSSETKNILGYNCQKVVVKIKNQKTSTIWFTNEIQGMNDLCNPYPSLIKGMVLSDSTETSRYISVLEVSAIKPDANLIENLRFKVPEGFMLFCGDVYLNNSFYGNYEYVSLNADMVSFNDKQPAIDMLTTEIDKAVRQSFKSENALPDAYFELTIGIDEKGNVTKVVKSETSDHYYPDVDMKKLSKNIKKNCVFDPTLLYGTPTVSTFTAMFIASKQK